MCETAIREGHQIFINELTRFAERAGDSRISAVMKRVDAPVSVAVRGRDGVGRGTVEAAMASACVTIVDAEELGGAMTDKLAELFDEQSREEPEPPRRRRPDAHATAARASAAARRV